MKPIIYFLFTTFLIFGCYEDNSKKDNENIKVKDLNATIDSLNKVIELKESVQKYNYQIPKIKKYAFVTIEISIPLMNYDTRDEIHLTEYKEEIRISNIIEIEAFSKEKEQRLINEFNEKVIFDNQPREIRIKKRKCYSYDSYEEASLAREKKILAK
jgi:hypothetical protein